MVVLICGGRDYVLTESDLADLTMRHFRTPVTLVITGGARGVDSVAAAWAGRHAIPVRTFLPDWAIGKAAGPIRNRTMLAELQRYASTDLIQVWAFPGGAGTADMTRQVRQAGVEVVRLGTRD